MKKQAVGKWRKRGRLILGMLVGVLGAQVITMVVFALYKTFLRVAQAAGSRLDVSPWWLGMLILVEILVVVGVCLYYYR